MIIKQLRLNNFRQFKGETIVNFSCDREKNVTVILGDNTYGKTTLLQAFNWCFYGKAILPNKEMLLNYDVADTMADGAIANVEVEVTLLHGGKEQIISRKQKYRKMNTSTYPEQPMLTVCIKTVDGPIDVLPSSLNTQKIINQILPENLSGYFFFDTERVGTISESRDLTDAVKGLLGLNTLNEARKHLGNRQAKTTVIGGFYAAMDVGGNQKAEHALENINNARENIDSFKNQIDNCEKEIGIYNARKDQLEQKLRASKETAELQREREKYAKWVEREVKDLEKMKQDLIDYFGNGEKKLYGSLKFFTRPLIAEALAYLKAAKVDDKGIIGLEAPTLKALLERGVCVCGQKLEKGNEAYKHIENELMYVPPEHIGTSIKNYIELLNHFSDGSENIFAEMSNTENRIKASTARINSWKEEIEEINSKIQGKENMQSYEIELGDVKRKINEFTSKKNSLLTRIGAEENRIEQNQKAYDKLIATTSKNAQLRRYIAYAEALQEWFEEIYKNEEGVVKKTLQEKVNNIFNKMYHGSRIVEINEKYQVSLLAKIGDQYKVTGESEGLNRVKNFAFIAGLVSMAKEKAAKKVGDQEYVLREEPYPLVMDAPFSNADEHHTANISRELPEIAEQIIMFVMKKDWHYAEPVILNRVGKRFKLEKQSEQYTVLKEVE